MTIRELYSEPECRKIAFFLATPWGGGAERVMVSLANAIADRGLDIDLVTFDAGSYRDKLSDKVQIVDLGSTGAMMSIPGLVRYLKKVRPIAMLSTIEQANIALLLAKRISGVPVRVVIREANSTSLSLNSTRGFRGYLHKSLLSLCYPWGDEIIAVSEGVAKNLASRMNGRISGINVVYNPVLTEKLRQEASEQIDHEWFTPGRPPVILGVGRLSPQKDFATLIYAFAELRRKKEAKLVILGEGEEREKLESLALELGVADDLCMQGYSSNPYVYMARASVFVLSSRFEGLPNALIEALVLGIPVVSTDCESGPKEILQDGKYGKLVPVADPSAMCSAITESLNKDRNEDVSQYALVQFSLQTAVDRYLQIMAGNSWDKTQENAAVIGGRPSC